MNWLALIEAIIGASEKVVPMFIHNPKSQQLEAVVFTDLNSVAGIVDQVVQANVSKTTSVPTAPMTLQPPTRLTSVPSSAIGR